MPNFPISLDANSSLLVAKDFTASNLRATMTNSQNTIPVTDASGFPDPAGATYYVAIDAGTASLREICGYTGLDLTGGANALTGVTRHLFSTNTTTHAIGPTVELYIVASFHEGVKAAILAIEAKVGIDASAVNTSHDFKLSEVLTADKAVGKTAVQTMTFKTINGATFDEIILSATASRIRPGATSLSLRNNANNADNLVLTDAGAATFRSTVGGITTLTATTLAGTLSTAAQTAITTVGTLLGLSINGNLTFTGTSSRLIASATDFTIRDAANANSNVAITDAGAITVRSTISGVTTLTATTLAGTLSTAAQTNVTSLGVLTALSIGGNLTFTGASRTIIAGTTSFAIRDNGNANDNLGITDAGAITVRSTIGGVTTLTATTLAGTLSTAAQPNVTSIGALATSGTFAVSAAGFASFARQYYSARFNVAFSATPTFDWNNGNVQSMTLTGAITSMTLNNGKDGGRYAFIFTQDATGGRTVAWPAAWKWSGGVAPTSSGANKVDVYGAFCDGTNYYASSSVNY